jgi:hypothetical protein
MSEKASARVAFITRPNWGIGLETARGLGKLGLAVVLGSRPEPRGWAAAEKRRSKGIKSIEAFRFDMTRLEERQEVARHMKVRCGKLDVLVKILLFCCLGSPLLPDYPAMGGEMLTRIQTQSTSPPGGLVPTNWGPGTSGVNSPLSFQQFDPKFGDLLDITITLTTNIRNDFTLTFVQTPIPTTIFVATSATSDPSILTDPEKRAMLTDGPTVTLFAPNGTTQLFGPPATTHPVDFFQLTETSGTWSSLLPATDPKFIPPAITQQSFSRTLTESNAPSLFADFIGTGNVDLPVTAEAFSSIFSNSGNGGGGVLTKARAVVTIQYGFVPEPSSIILLGLGTGLGCLGKRIVSRRRTSTSDSRRARKAKGPSAAKSIARR